MNRLEATLSLEPSFVFSFQADQNYYASTYYDGTEKFKKHYYSRISTGQEVECAKLIDRSSHVAHWVRNVPRTENSFALPCRTQAHYYPDFVVQLPDALADENSTQLCLLAFPKSLTIYHHSSNSPAKACGATFSPCL